MLADCSVCSENYAPNLSFTCRKCFDRRVGVATAVVLAVLVLAVGLVVILYLVSAEEGGAGRGIVNRVMKRIPMQSVKIIIVVWQILTQVSTDTVRRLSTSII